MMLISTNAMNESHNEGIPKMATITPKELALALDTDARTVRKFLRSTQGLDMKVGKGHRWAIEAKQVRSLKARFSKWVEATNATTDADDAPADN